MNLNEVRSLDRVLLSVLFQNKLRSMNEASDAVPSSFLFLRFVDDRHRSGCAALGLLASSGR
ncbi:hypothetical protein D8780_10460 [Notoacmeibacter ruber]|uniref:Uncharacterized protein n=1 Tax=Notoacmeibacter ruber TaxID=2670375 RepID=A0A3L7JE26_9HYPH|nr:hypothetical protein D8780_06660 [Notoacmeibacter ruber]RLQ88565.1 hypothetical protein D8780_10460 [Notoacmeibacter ruber]